MFRFGRRPRPVRLVIERLEARDVPGFLPGVAYNAGYLPVQPVIDDFNGDGHRDVAVTIQSGSTVRVLLGDGTGSLAAGGSYPSGGKTANGLAASDLNLDGTPDLVVTNSTNNGQSAVGVLRGRGDGTFLPAVTFSTEDLATRLSLGDFNNDGRPDVAVTCHGADSVDVLLGNGDGALQAAVSYKVGLNPRSVQTGDLNGDGRLDLTVDNGNGASYSVLLGAGNGAFLPAQTYGLGFQPWGHALADVNKDGRLDLVVANPGAGSVGVLLGNGDGTFQAPVAYPVGGTLAAYPVVADFNRDRRPDIAVVGSYTHDGTQPVSVLLGKGDGTFQSFQDYPVAASLGLAAGDLNNDRYPDLVVAPSLSSSVVVLLNDANWAAPMPPGPVASVATGAVAAVTPRRLGSAPPAVAEPATAGTRGGTELHPRPHRAASGDDGADALFATGLLGESVL
jgi:hypothetical protein